MYFFTTREARVVCPLAERTLEGSVDIVTPYGFSGFVGIGQAPELPAHWRRFVTRRGYVCGYIGLHPVLEEETYTAPESVSTHNSVWVLDLTLSLDQLYRNLRKSRRQELRKDASIEVVVDRQALTDFFVRNYAAVMEARGAAAVYFFGAEALKKLLALDHVLLLGVAEEGRIVRVTAFAYTPDVADALLSVSLPEGRSKGTTLLWHGALALKERGVACLNLGGGVRPGDGIAAFKRGFGAREMALRCLKEIYDPAAYGALCERAGVTGREEDGYFPPYRRRAGGGSERLEGSRAAAQ